MNRQFIPTYFANSIYEIDFNKVIEKGYKYLFIDLDNTLASPDTHTPESRTIELINLLKSKQFFITILSNNDEERVKKFVDGLDINYMSDVKKPSTKKVDEYILANNIDKSKTLVIGDQVMTDVVLANRLYVDVVLLEQLTKTDELITFVPRLFDKYFKKKFKKKKMLKDL